MQLEDITLNANNTINRVCLEQRLQQGTITLLMTESRARFYLGHIPGSQCFSVGLLAHLPRETPVVLYAAHDPSLVTQWAYWLLLERGFTVWIYVGGLHDWRRAGCPLYAETMPILELMLNTEPPDTETDTTPSEVRR